MAGSSSILLIEDEDNDAFLFHIALKKCRPQTRLLRRNGGAEALNFIQQTTLLNYPERPDLIVLDLKLPELHGFELLEHLSRLEPRPQQPIVVLSSGPTPEDCAHAMELGVREVINKPSDPAALQAIVAGLVARYLPE